MSDIFQEVQEEFRREQLAQFWSKYRALLIGGAVALILAVGAYEVWSVWRDSAREAASRQYETALSMSKGGDPKAVEAFAKLGNSTSGGYEFAAKLQEAALRASAGDKKGAVAIYDRIAESGFGGEVITDYSRVRAGLLLAESAPLADVKSRLDPVAAKDGPFQAQAQELLAFSNWRAGDNKEALRLYELVAKSAEASSGVKRRAQEMAALIGNGLKAADVKPPAPKPAATAPALPSLLPAPGAPATTGTPAPEVPAPDFPSQPLDAQPSPQQNAPTPTP